MTLRPARALAALAVLALGAVACEGVDAPTNASRDSTVVPEAVSSPQDGVPGQSAGSCPSAEEVKAAFEVVVGRPTIGSTEILGEAGTSCTFADSGKSARITVSVSKTDVAAPALQSLASTGRLTEGGAQLAATAPADVEPGVAERVLVVDGAVPQCIVYAWRDGGASPLVVVDAAVSGTSDRVCTAARSLARSAVSATPSGAATASAS